MIVNQLDPAPFNPALAGSVFSFPIVAAGGNVPIPNVPSRTSPRSRSPPYEIGYTGIIKQRATVSAAWFHNDTKMTLLHAGRLLPRHQPAAGLAAAGVRARAAVLRAGTVGRNCPFGVGYGLPSAFSYLNFGKVRQKGMELGVDGSFSKELSAFANYSYQPNPRRSASRSRR